ncbi:hypothetical protein BDQ17DRAFT_1385925 [Cyathus striatus]|nr:hypothetical protein BDQ17DRAFT_1385925 [Cyathus striatus]
MSSSAPRPEDYDASSSTDSELPRRHSKSRPPFAASTSATNSSGSSSSPRHSVFLFPPRAPSGSASVSSTASSTPLPSRSTSPLPYYTSNPSSSCPSDTESEPSSPLIRSNVNRNPWWRESRRSWWSMSRRRRRRTGRITRTLKKWIRRLVRHPFFPGQPITIVLTLLMLSVFAICLTLLLIYILNPDKEPLPWRAYCFAPSTSLAMDLSSSTSSQPMPNITTGVLPFPPANLDSLPPAGVFVGVFSVDSAIERRMLVRSTWAGHGDDGTGTSRTLVRFILGQPKKDWERRIKLEMEMYNDIIILPIQENMNGGKTHTFFSWASINAWVPPVYFNSTVPPPQFSYSNHTSAPPSLAPHDPFLAWNDLNSGTPRHWVRPDYVVKVDDDSFVMLAELESRLRVELHVKTNSTQKIAPRDATALGSLPPAIVPNNDPLVYWGYLVSNRLHQFMAGELYALSWSLVDYVSKDPNVKTITKGAEDKQTAKWMRSHPRASEVRWTSERCWIYDHPRAGTVYVVIFFLLLFRSRLTDKIISIFREVPQTPAQNEIPESIGHISPMPCVNFGVRYIPPVPDLSTTHSVEALVEGSDMQSCGGTVVVHFIKKHMWFLETALALLEGEELSETEKYEKSRAAYSTGTVLYERRQSGAANNRLL